MQSSGTVNVRQKVVEELEIALAIKDHHRQPVWILRGADDSHHVLRNDVLQERGLAGPSHAQHDALHDAHSVRPIPRLTMDVVAKNHGVLFPSFGRKLFVSFPGDDHRWMWPLLFPPGTCGGNQDGRADDGQAAQSQVAAQLGNLAVREEETLAGYVPGKPADCHENEGDGDLHAFQNRWILLAVNVRVAHHCTAVTTRSR